MKASRTTLNSSPLAVLASALFLLLPARAALASNAVKTVELKINAGETRVIEGLASTSMPAVRVIENPHALVIHNEEPGKMTLLGAEAGHWDIDVKEADGSDLTYDVVVSAIANKDNPLKAGEAPPAYDGRAAAAPPPYPSSGTPSSTDWRLAKASSGSSAPAASASPSSTDTMNVPASGGGSGSAAPTVVAAAAPAPDSSALAPTIPSQTVNPSAAAPGETFRTDPSVAESGGQYQSDSVDGGTHYLPSETIAMMSGTSQIFDFPQRIRRVSIADSAIADIQVVNPYQLNLIGHKPGFTTLAVWNSQGRYQERQVRIEPHGVQQVLLNCMVAELNRTSIENQGMNIAAAATNLGLSFVSLPGNVATPYSSSSLLYGGQMQNAFGTITNANIAPIAGPTLPGGGQLIPLLLSQNMTYGITGGNSNVQTQAFIQFLETHNMARILAQPHLLANSGEEAKFLSGGEIPIVIAQALNTSIVFKEFGTKVGFVPTVVGRNNIELLVKPELSEPDYAHGVQLFGFSIPAFVTRRAETLVRLKDTQTLIIAGLILHDKREVINKVPYLGDIPYVAGLFRTTSWQNTESDLVMSVTPQIVKPLPEGAEVYTPSKRGPLTYQEIRTEKPATPEPSRPRF
jgi:pilus assembly protein CpaC